MSFQKRFLRISYPKNSRTQIFLNQLLEFWCVEFWNELLLHPLKTNFYNVIIFYEGEILYFLPIRPESCKEKHELPAQKMHEIRFRRKRDSHLKK